MTIVPSLGVLLSSKTQNDNRKFDVQTSDVTDLSVSSSMTSMTGVTTVLLFSAMRASMGSSQPETQHRARQLHETENLTGKGEDGDNKEELTSHLQCTRSGSRETSRRRPWQPRSRADALGSNLRASFRARCASW